MHVKEKVAASAAAASDKRKGKTALLWLNVLQTAMLLNWLLRLLPLLFVAGRPMMTKTDDVLPLALCVFRDINYE